jgi:hypothetical protein
VSTTALFCNFTAGANVTSTGPSAFIASSPASVSVTGPETVGHAGDRNGSERRWHDDG